MIKLALAIYYLVGAIYYVAGRLRDKRKRSSRGYEAVLIFMLPFAGLLYLAIAKLDRRGDDAEENVHLLQLMTKDTAALLEHNVYRGVNLEKERNIVPLEEALLVNSLAIRRRMILDVLKDDVHRYSPMLLEAVSNEDTETAHYAVSGIMEIKRKAMLDLQAASVRYEQHRDDPKVLSNYAETLKRYMTSGFLDSRTLRRHQLMYSQTLGELLGIDTANLQAYEEKINCELALERYDHARETCGLLMKAYPAHELTYVMRMKIAYMTGSDQEFKHTLEELKRSRIQVSSNTLKYIRFWSKGVGNEVLA